MSADRSTHSGATPTLSEALALAVKEVVVEVVNHVRDELDASVIRRRLAPPRRRPGQQRPRRRRSHRRAAATRGPPDDDDSEHAGRREAVVL